MSISLVSPAALVALAAALVFAPLPAAAQSSLTADEQAIIDECLTQGASAAECSCGVEQARQVMTEREVSLLAAMVPQLSGETDLEVALMAAPQIAQEQGFTTAEFAAAMQKIFAHYTVVETQCADPVPAAPADGAAQ